RYRTGHANLSQRIADRLQTVLAVLRRSLIRPRDAEVAGHTAVRAAGGSNCRCLGLAVRRGHRDAAAGLDLAGTRHDGRRPTTLRALAATAMRAVRRNGAVKR